MKRKPWTHRILALSMATIMWVMVFSGSALAYGKDYTAYMVGNSHIDTVWKWLLEESAVECNTTFTRQINNINSNSDFIFTASCAKHYAWTKEYYPDLYEDIKEKFASGQWENVGGQIVEPDLNVPNGESLVRQFLYGQKFFEDEFGEKCTVGWVPDVFGFSGQMPQMLEKSGFNSFVTTKLNWNDTTTFPYELFKWQGLDGTEIVTYKPMKDYVHIYQDVDITNSMNKPSGLGVKKSLCLYGKGDHGGGPTQDNINLIRTQDGKSNLPQVKFKKAEEYFSDLTEQEKANLPVWTGELYLEKHRGVYTTHGKMKQYERDSEILAEKAEKYAFIASNLGAMTYPKVHIQDAWDKILTNQMHDILPGSSWINAYDEAWDDYEVALNMLGNTRNQALYGLADRIDTNVDEGVPVVVFNSLSWERDGIVEVEVNFDTNVNYVKVMDEAGTIMPSQVLTKLGKKATIAFEGRDLPSIGYKVFKVVNVATEPSSNTGLTANSNVMENNYVRVELNSTTGNISRIYDKVNDKEVLQTNKEANEYHVYYDRPGYWHAWDLERYQFTPSTNFTVVNGLQSINLVEEGPVKTTYRVVRNFSNSNFTQDISLYHNSPEVEIDVTADWHEGDKCLKVSFPLNVNAPKAAFDIAYGAIERTNGYDAPKFEVPGHKWADLSEADYGVAVMNDSKYGWDTIESNRLRLTLLRGPTTPLYNGTSNGGPRSDQGIHNFSYSIYPHAGDWKEADIQAKAYEFNYGTETIQVAEHNGDLSKSKSFVTVNKSNVIITAMKEAERDGSLILRAYETEGQTGTNANFTFANNVTSVKETNLIEEEEGALTPSGNSFASSFDPFEIKSFKINMSSSDYEATKPTSTTVDLSSDYNLDGVSPDSNRSDGNLGSNRAFSAELFPSSIEVEDITFNLGPKANGQENIVRAEGQTITLNGGNKDFIYILGASTDGDTSGQFTLTYTDGTTGYRTINMSDWRGEIGGWLKTRKTDKIGKFFTHYHNSSSDELVHDNYLFYYAVPLNKDKQIQSITLPNNTKMKIAAMTLVEGSYMPTPDTSAPTKVTGLTANISDLRNVDLQWNASTDNKGVAGYRIYRGTEAGFSVESNMLVDVQTTSYMDPLGSYDTYYYRVAAYDSEGNMGPLSDEVSVEGGLDNIALNKTAEASGNVAAEPPEKAFDGSVDDNSKWCATGNEPHWLKVDLGKSYDIFQFEVKHASEGGESASYNTKAFKLQVSDDGETWSDAITVTDNTLGITSHSVEDVTGRYVRLYVTDATNQTDTAARIYELSVFGRESGNEPPPPNPTLISQGKPATASGNVASETPALAVDGQVENNSKWCETGNKDHWLQVDLQAVYSINKFIVKHASAGAESTLWNTEDFKIQTSLDGATWNDVVNVVDNTEGETEHAVTNASGRYVRLYITKATQNTDYAARIYEFQTFGTLAPEPAVSTVIDLATYFNADGFTLDANKADGNLDGLGYTYGADEVSGEVEVNEMPFRLGSFEEGANNVVNTTGQTIQITGLQCDKVAILGSSTNGHHGGNVTLQYEDGTTSVVNLAMKDWCKELEATDTAAISLTHRHKSNDTVHDVNNYIFLYQLEADATKTLVGIQLPNNEKIHVYALTCHKEAD